MPVVQVGNSSTGEAEARLLGEVEELRREVEEVRGSSAGEVARLAGELEEVQAACRGLQQRVEELEARPSAEVVEEQEVEKVVKEEEEKVKEVIASVTAEQGGVDMGEVARLQEKVEAQLALVRIQPHLTSLHSTQPTPPHLPHQVREVVAAPLSVAFDAVRCEDFLGTDGWLPFTKLNANLGEGMDPDTGVFTVPIRCHPPLLLLLLLLLHRLLDLLVLNMLILLASGLYLFLLNVYGAPRDGVTLSIK